MLNRVLISLAQLKAGNNSDKLKNEIRQILHSLCRPKKLTKNVYKVWSTLFKTWKQSLCTPKIVRQMSLTNLFISLLTNLILKLQIAKILD